MHPIELLATRLEVLLLLEGSSISRRCAYPDASPTAHSGSFNWKIYRMMTEAERMMQNVAPADVEIAIGRVTV